MKIFFSYGHDHHAEFIQKIRQDLINKYGLDIWIDNIELRAKSDWERHIEKGIEDSDEIVYFLTPYSARRDDGYCLNELAYSCIHKKSIIPIMVDYVVPPLSIARVQYLDIRSLKLNYSEKQYDIFLRNLISIIKGEKELTFESDQFDLLNYLDPLDFSYDISKHLKNFIGRQWLYEKVDDLLENDESRVLWITAEAGFGKTSFSTHLMHKHKSTIGIHYCKHDNPKRKNSRSVLTTLIYQISTQISEYKDILNSDRYKKKLKDLKISNANEILDELLIQPLNKINPNENYFFIIDALDEAQEEGSNKLADLIQKFDDLPSWLKIVVTSRPEPYLKRKLSKLKIIELDTQSEQNLDDLRLFIKEHVNDKNCDVLKDAVIQSALIEKSEGNILYLKEVIDSIIKGDINEDEIMELPSGMTGLYVNMFERYFPDVKEYEEKVMPIFELLCASNAPLSKESISEILDIKKREFKKIIDSIGSLIEENLNNEIYFYHKSLADWLIDEDLCSDDYFIDIEEGHKKIFDYYINNRYINNENSGLILSSLRYLKKFQELFEFCDKNSYLDNYEVIAKYYNPINGDLNLIKEYDYDINVLLTYAISAQNINLIQLLVENKANPNHINNFQQTPLLYLCKNFDNLEVLKLLLKYGADLNIKDEIGYDSRLYTILEKRFDLMHYLFDIGEIPYQYSPDENDDYLLAALDSDNVEYFKKHNDNGIDLTQKNVRGRNLLFLAGEFNAKKCLEYFINKVGLDFNNQDINGDTPLIYLLSSDNLTNENIEECERNQASSEEQVHCPYDIIKTYLELGADPNIFAQNGSTPLYWAVAKDLYKICQLLIKYGADPDLAVSSGTTPFVYAAAKCDLKYLELLIPKVKDINYKAKHGLTALMIAAKSDPMLVKQGKSNYEKVKYLLDNGADKTLVADNGYTAYDYAVEPEIKKILDSNSLTEDYIHEFLSNANSDQVYELYIYSSNTKNLLEHTFKRFLLTVKDLITKNDFERAKDLSRGLSEKISNELCELSKDIKEFSDYINELVMYDIKVQEILNYQNHSNYSIENFVNYFNLISEAYPKNEDIWWSSYIACCINSAYYFNSLQFKESSIFAYEALKEIEKVEKEKIHTFEDHQMFEQFKKHNKELINIVNAYLNLGNTLIDNNLVLDNEMFLSFISKNSQEILDKYLKNKELFNFTEPLKTLLLISKGLSIKYNNSTNISLDLLYTALHSVELSPKAKNVFRALFGDNNIDELNEDTDGFGLIEIAKDHPTINYDENMKNIVKQLDEIFGENLILNIRKSIIDIADEIPRYTEI